MTSHRLLAALRERCPEHRAGTAALEFVIVLPVLIVLVIGATDLSRALHDENILSNAARVGAAYGVTHQVTDYIADDWEARVIERATEEAAHLSDFDPLLFRVDVSTFDELDGSKRVQVTTSYPFDFLFHWPGWPRSLLLEHEVSMRSYR